MCTILHQNDLPEGAFANRFEGVEAHLFERLLDIFKLLLLDLHSIFCFQVIRIKGSLKLSGYLKTSADIILPFQF